jgi:hypothetical protein
MTHTDEAQQLVAGAVLGDLSPDEGRMYLEHRATCGACLALEIQLDHVMADLSLVVAERVPPPDLFAGIRAAIAADAGERTPLRPEIGVAASEAATHRPVAVQGAPDPIPLVPVRHRGQRAQTWAAVGLAAVIGIVAVGLGTTATGLADELARTESALASLQRDLASQSAVMAVAADPRHVTAPMQAEPVAAGATALVLYVPGTADAWFVATGLPPTPDGHGYQLWYADEAGVHGLGTFAHDGTGAFVAPFSVDLAHSAAAMLTLEPVGGATAEPGPQVIFGELSSES